MWSRNSLVVLTRRAQEPEPHKADYGVEQATIRDADDYASRIGTESAATFRERLSSGGARCFLVRSGGSVVHATWVATRPARVGEVRRLFCTPPGDAYLYESFTRSEVRGQGIYPFALRWIAARLHRDGVRRLWIAATADNRSSLQAIVKAGFERHHEVAYVRRLGWVSVRGPARGPALIRRSCERRDGTFPQEV